MCIQVLLLNSQDDGHDFIAIFLHLFSLFLSGNSTLYFFEGGGGGGGGEKSTKW